MSITNDSMCQQFNETVEHFTALCAVLAKDKCMKSCDLVCTHFYFEKQLELKVERLPKLDEIWVITPLHYVTNKVYTREKT
jgi:hypothetical protein